MQTAWRNGKKFRGASISPRILIQ